MFSLILSRQPAWLLMSTLSALQWLKNSLSILKGLQLMGWVYSVLYPYLPCDFKQHWGVYLKVDFGNKISKITTMWIRGHISVHTKIKSLLTSCWVVWTTFIILSHGIFASFSILFGPVFLYFHYIFKVLRLCYLKGGGLLPRVYMHQRSKNTFIFS